METQITPRRTYFLVYLALMLLLAATLGAAFLDLGFLNPVVAVGIAVLKAILVILFFMHARGKVQPGSSGSGSRNDLAAPLLFVFAGFFWLLIMVGLTLTDYLTRAP